LQIIANYLQNIGVGPPKTKITIAGKLLI